MQKLIAEWRASSPEMRLACALVAVAAALSLLLTLLNYPVIGHDAYVHLNWLDQFVRLREQGITYPRWLPDSFGGFGSPTFYFYPPLPYLMASVLHSLYPFSAQVLYNLLSLIASVGAATSSWFLLREISSSRLAVLTGALCYAFLSYHFCDVFVRDALGEQWGLMFLPLVFLRVKGQKGPIGRMGVLSVVWAGLFLSNLPIAYVALVTLVLWIAARRAWRELPTQFTSLIIASMAAAVYLHPAMGMRSEIHQRHLWDLPMNTSMFGFALLDLVEKHFDWLRILSVGTLLAGVAVIVAKLREPDNDRSGWLWIAVLAIALQLPLTPLWRIMWGMPFVQFSWRWNGVLLLAIAVLFVSNPRKSIQCILIALSLLTILSELTLSRNLFVRPPLPINAYRADAPEYAPKWAANDPGEVIAITQRRMSDPPAVILGLTSPGDTVQEISRLPELRTFDVHLQRPATVRFHQFYWPQWYATTTDTALNMGLQPDPNGLAILSLPAGHYRVQLRLTEYFTYTFVEYTTWIGFFLMVSLLSAGAIQEFSARRRIASS